MILKAIWLEYQAQSRQHTSERHAASKFTRRVRQWCYIIILPLIGLLALAFCLSLGGAFALVGPWGILIAVCVMTRRLKVERL